MVHMFKYVRSTKDLPLIPSAYNSGMLKWYIDGSYGVHHNARGAHWGSTDNGRRITNPDINQTEAQHYEFHKIGNDWSWTTNAIATLDQDFLEYQGYEVTDNIIYQDNKITIILEKNGNSSSSKRTKHINILYFCNWQDL